MARAKFEGLMLLRGGLYVEITREHLDQQRSAVKATSDRVDRLSSAVNAQRRRLDELAAKIANAGKRRNITRVGILPPENQDYEDVVYKEDFDAGWRACFVAIFGDAAEARSDLPEVKSDLARLETELKAARESRERLASEYRRALVVASRRAKARCRKLEAQCNPPP